jgi:hypothetical protein
MSDSLDLSINPVFDVIKPQSGDQRQFSVVIGYVAEVTDDHVKVYPTLDLRNYVEISRGDIIWAEKAVPGQQSSPTKLVIKSESKVRRAVPHCSVEEGFMSGSITDGHLSKAASGVTVNVNVGTEFVTPPCPTPTPIVKATPTGYLIQTVCHHTGVCFSDATH